MSDQGAAEAGRIGVALARRRPEVDPLGLTVGELVEMIEAEGGSLRGDGAGRSAAIDAVLAAWVRARGEAGGV